jgi:cobalt/nickel transport system ATP-binding protein
VNTIIKVSNINYSYSKEIIVLKNISFTLDKDNTMGIIGPNGAGKTTLLYALSGLIDTGGSIIIDGETLTKKTIKSIRKKTSFVFQNPDDQLFMPTVYEDISFGLDKLGFSNNDVDNIVKNVLKKVEMQGFEDRSAHHLSLGQKKRICLASALARNSKLMYFDEPTNELDPQSRREFIKLIKEITTTKIIVSHDLNLILEICDTVMVINNQEIKDLGECKTILSDKNLMESNRLEVPFDIRNYI